MLTDDRTPEDMLQRVMQVQTVVDCPEESIFIALHDNEFDVGKACEALLDNTLKVWYGMAGRSLLLYIIIIVKEEWTTMSSTKKNKKKLIEQQQQPKKSFNSTTKGTPKAGNINTNTTILCY